MKTKPNKPASEQLVGENLNRLRENGEEIDKLKKQMNKPNTGPSAQEFADSIKNPEPIIEWAENEIKEYKKLIKMLKSKLNK